MLQNICPHEFTEPWLKDDKNLSEFRNGISNEDQKFLKVTKKNTVLFNDHYQIPLPQKDPDQSFQTTENKQKDDFKS